MPIVPENLKCDLRNLNVSLLHADRDRVIEIIEKNQLTVNEILEPQTGVSILHKAVNPLNEFRGTTEQIELVNYLLSAGADPNIKTSAQCNALHVALEYHDLSAIALLLITKGRADVHAVERNGNSPLFIAIREFGLTWRPEQKQIRQLRFKIVEELLACGASLDAANKHGVTPRQWVERANSVELSELVLKYESL